MFLPLVYADGQRGQDFYGTSLFLKRKKTINIPCSLNKTKVSNINLNWIYVILINLIKSFQNFVIFVS